MRYYPLYADLENRKCIVIGGGEVAERKVESLLECRADVTVISPQLTERLDELAHSREVKYLKRMYRRGDLENAFLVVGATDNAELNAIIFHEACQKNIMVNIVDDPDKCSFIVPSVVDRGDLLISISTSGSCPALSKKIRKYLEEEFGEEYVDYLKLLRSARDKIKQKYESMEERKRSLNRVIDLNVLPLLREGKRDLAEKKVEECI